MNKYSKVSQTLDLIVIGLCMAGLVSILIDFLA